jgi:hypothetical protein
MNEDRYVYLFLFPSDSCLCSSQSLLGVVRHRFDVLMVSELTQTITGVSGIPNRAQRVKPGYLLLKNSVWVRMTRENHKLADKELLDEDKERAKSGFLQRREQSLLSILTQPQYLVQMSMSL